MIQQKRGTCTGKDGEYPYCEREDVPLISSRQHCNYCSNKWKQSNKKSNVSKNKKVKKKTGELAMFLEIWMERKHQCEWCKKPLFAFKVHYFDHIKPKGTYPELRLVKSNIQLLCYYWDDDHGWYGCHHIKTHVGKEEFNKRKDLFR